MVTYKDSGVDINKSNIAKKKLKEVVKSTFSKNVLTNIGTFGALYYFDHDDYKKPVLVSSTDGVGTKIKLAIKSKKFDTIGQDLVNHCVNDILAMGAKPLYFLDYIALGKMRPNVVEDIVIGLAKACKENNCSLIGGETAEMPGLYKASDFDLAGFIVGIADKDKIIDGSKIEEGDVIIGLASNGLQTNGYSLANKVFFDIGGYKLDDKPDELEGQTLVQALMAVHPSYLKPIEQLIKNEVEIKGMAHITGGGLLENIPRILPTDMSVKIDKTSWEVPAIFTLIKRIGNVPEKDMYRTLNMGIGYVFIVSREEAAKASNVLSEMKVEHYVIGEVIEGNQEVLISLDQ